MKQRRFLSVLLALCLVLGMLPGTVFAAGGRLPFTDVKTADWYYDAVQYVYEKGMMTGTGAATFSPNSTTSRGMIVTILHRLEGTPSAVGAAFTDVPAGQWYTDAVAWASANEIVDGYGNGKFGPDDPITREQMATILYRYSRYKGYDTTVSGSLSGFSDAAKTSSYAANAMGWAVGTGLIAGMDDGTLAPQGNATRAQAATIFMRYCENVDGISVSGFPDDEISLINFTADVYDIYLNTEETVIFTVEVLADTFSREDTLAVYDDSDQFIVYMNDNGVNGDAVANDSIYSGKATLSSTEIKLVNYYASIRTVKSNSFEICFYRDLSQDEFISFTQLLNIISALPFGQAYEYVKTSSEISTYSIDVENQIITYQSIYGIYGIWEEYPNSGVKGNGSLAIPASCGADYSKVEKAITSAIITPAIVNKSTIILRPFRGSDFPYDDFKTTGELLTKALDSNLEVIDDEAVTVSVMQSLGSYGIILIDSHGMLDNFSTPYMLIGEELNENKFLWDPIYYLQHVGYSADYLSGRIYCTNYNNRIAIGGKFFEKYYSPDSLTGSYWFLGTCYSMFDDSIADVLINKGASAIVGFSDTVSVDYCNNTLFETTLNSMLLSADTIGNSIQCAKNIYGEVDPMNSNV